MKLNKTIGIFEAKTHFSQICEQVNRSGQSLTVERRGKPLVVIAPAESLPREDDGDILSAWRRWTEKHPAEDGDFPDVQSLRRNKKASPLE